MTHPTEICLDPDQGIDREVLAELRARFLQLNERRLARALKGLSARRRQVLTLLPLLLHVNHPALPGYVSATTAAGVAGFEPGAPLLDAAARLGGSPDCESWTSDPARPIHGLYLMGSLGTLAQAEQSDMDLWICHAPDLAKHDLADLTSKCRLLEAWAASQGAEAHLFLIESRRFAQAAGTDGPAIDNSDSARQCLLLDEFYRTAIWLAGRTPLWWLVPAERERDYHAYTQALLSRQLIQADDHLDLGHLAEPAPGKLVEAARCQLRKGLDSPYKSLLKLLLVEVYATEHPHVRYLSLDFKRAVFAGPPDIDRLDPYLMIYRRIERYLLESGDDRRLEQARRSLYLKTGRRLSGRAGLAQDNWQSLLLGRLIEEWGWPGEHLVELDGPGQPDAARTNARHRLLLDELEHNYERLVRLATPRPE
ncbi:class I adenylate cyclase [Pseudomonas sp. Marseille-QA0332]